MVRELFLDEDIPLPGTSTRQVEVFVRHAVLSPALPAADEPLSLRNVTEEELKGAFWVAKLLDLHSLLFRGLVDMLTFREHLWYVVPPDVLYNLADSLGAELDPCMLVNIFAKLVRDPEAIPPRLTAALLERFLDSEQQAVREGALQALKDAYTVEANVLLLQHRDYAARSSGLKFFRSAEPSEAVVEALKPLAECSSFLVKEVVAQSLAACAPVGSPAAVSLLLRMMRDGAREPRRAAASALALVAVADDPDVTNVLLDMVLEPCSSEPLRCEALQALVTLAPSLRSEVEELARSMQGAGGTMSKFGAAAALSRLQRAAQLRERELQEDEEDEEDDECQVAAPSPGTTRATPSPGTWADASSDEED